MEKDDQVRDCPRCKTKMEHGFVAYGSRWAKGDYGKVYRAVGFMGKHTVGPLIIAWRCPSCKTIELVSE